MRLGYVSPRTTPASASCRSDASHGLWRRCPGVTPRVPGPIARSPRLWDRARLLPSGASDAAKTSHWSNPLFPAFCHIIELMARSAPTSVSWNQRAPTGPVHPGAVIHQKRRREHAFRLMHPSRRPQSSHRRVDDGVPRLAATPSSQRASSPPRSPRPRCRRPRGANPRVLRSATGPNGWRAPPVVQLPVGELAAVETVPEEPAEFATLGDPLARISTPNRGTSRGEIWPNRR